MNSLHTGYWLGLAMFFMAPLAVYAPKGMVILLGFVALAILVRFFKENSYLKPLKSPFSMVVLGLFFWCILSTSWALDGIASLRLAGTLGLLGIAAVTLTVACSALKEKERQIAQRAMFLGTGLGIALLLFELIGDLPINRMLRIESEGLRPTILNSALSVSAIMVWPSLLIAYRSKNPMAALILLLLVIMALVLGEGNSARVAFLLAAITALVAFHWPLITKMTLIITAVLGILAAPLLPSSILAPKNWEKVLSGVRDSAIHRLHIWNFSAERISEKPLFGWGLNASRIIPGGDREVIKDGASMQLHPHNAALQIWLELGVPGALALVALISMALAGRQHLPNSTSAASLATTVAAFTVALLSFGIWQHWWLSTLILSAIAVRIASEEPI